MVAGFVVHGGSECSKELRQTRLDPFIGCQLVDGLDGLPNKGVDGNAGGGGQFEQTDMVLFRQTDSQRFLGCF